MSTAAPAMLATRERPSVFARIDPRWYSSSLLTTVLAVGQWRFQILGDSYVPWLLALASAILTEIVLSRLTRAPKLNLLSAYISGNSIAILVKPQGDLLWPFVVGGVVSILSKYVLAWRGRHLWNPTNFGVCILLALAGSRVSILSHQWSNALQMVALLWCLGLFTVWRAKVLHITLAWLAAFLAFAALRAALLPDGRFWTEAAPVTGPMYTLFMFFMVTDPRTIVRGRGRQVLVAVAVAALECVFRLLAEHDLVRSTNPLAVAPPMFALFFVGAAALALQLASDRRELATRA